MTGLQACVPNSREARLARQGQITNKKAIVSIYLRRQALSQGFPYTVVQIGRGTDFLLRNGVLCFLSGNLVHVVKVHEASDVEVVFNLDIRLQSWAEKLGAPIKTKLQHYQDDVLIVSVSAQQQRKVMALNVKAGVSPQKRILAALNVPFGHEMIFRNDSTNLLVGRRQSEPDGDREWNFFVYRLTDKDRPHPKGEWLCKVPSFESRTEIGTTLALELIDGYLWVMTSEITPDPEGLDPVSYYGGYRYALDQPGNPARYWRFHRRRQHEGPIHDHWTTLSLRKDEMGHYAIAESRKEWLARFPDAALRSFYTMTFDPGSLTEDEMDIEYQELQVRQTREQMENQAKDDEDDFSDDETEYVGTLLKFLPEHLFAPWAHSQRSCHHEFEDLSPDAISPSLAQAATQAFPLGETPYRTYDTATDTFIEVVNDPEQHSGDAGSLRIRTGHKGSNITLWPPPGSPCPASLRPLLQPRTLSSFRGAADERCVVFGACTSRSSPIVLISYDPNMEFGSNLDTQKATLSQQPDMLPLEGYGVWSGYRASCKHNGAANGAPSPSAGRDMYKTSVAEYPALWTDGVVWWRQSPEALRWA